MADAADSEWNEPLRELAEGAGEADAHAPAELPQGGTAAVGPNIAAPAAAANEASSAWVGFPPAPSTPRLGAFRGFMIPFCTTIGLLNAAIGCWGVAVLTHRVHVGSEHADARRMAIAMTAVTWPIAVALLGAAAFYWRQWRREVSPAPR